MLEFFQWVQAWIAVIPTIVLIASFIAAVTPTPVDDGWMKKVYKVLDWCALNVGRAKYMALIEKLDKSEDTIKEMKAEAEAAKKQLAPPKRKFIDLFLDDNDINEKSIIGFLSFFLMFVFGTCDLITAFWGMDLQISDTIYTSFVVVTLGAFGISEAGKAFGGK